MSRLLGRVRTMLWGSSTQRALEVESKQLGAHTERQTTAVRKARAAYSAQDPGAIELGRAAEGWPVRQTVPALAAHSGLWGPSGSGKSYLLAAILKAQLRAGVRRLILADPKEETIVLAERAILDVANDLPRAEAEDLLGRVVVLDLFSERTLPKLQVLAPEPGLDPELHAYEIANLITTEMDMAAGFRQEAVLHRVVECLIRARLPLTVLPTALLEPALLGRLADSENPAELFRTTAQRLAKESKERVLGLVSRAERLLRLRSTRLALGGSESCIDFARLIDERITLINLAPPHGSADIGRFLSGLIWLKLAHAVRRRPNGSPRAHIAIDEWPTFLAAGGNRVADSFEELLRLARSKGVFLTVLSQDMASVAKISSSLPDVIRTNLHQHFVFRAADAHAWDFLLPVSGRRRRPAAAPWEERRAEFLERGSELTLLREELSRLPDRECYFVDRRTGLPGVRMRTSDLSLTATAEDARQLALRASTSDAVLTVTALEQRAHELATRVASLLTAGTAHPEDREEMPQLIPPRGRRDAGLG